MREQRTAKLKTLKSVFDILNLIPLLNVFSVKGKPFDCVQSLLRSSPDDRFFSHDEAHAFSHCVTKALKIFIIKYYFQAKLKDSLCHNNKNHNR